MVQCYNVDSVTVWHGAIVPESPLWDVTWLAGLAGPNLPLFGGRGLWASCGLS
jgi:hypothetical protein